MAKLHAVPAARIALLLGISSALGACSLDPIRGAPRVEIESKTTVQERFTDESSYTTVVPRTALSTTAINEDAPDRYEVVRGDTLWDISDRFLKEPWMWPQLWDYNPQIANPHLIYPGDLIAMEYVNGVPTLVIDRDGKRVSQSLTGDAIQAGLNSERWSPRIRSTTLDEAIPMIPADAIQSFLVHPRVLPLEELQSAPYVVGNFDGRLASAIGHQIFARGELSRETPQYSLFRQSKALRDPVTKTLLGYEVEHVSDAKLMHIGDPSTLIITSNNMETLAGDLLMSVNDDDIRHNYTTRMPKIEGDGRIVSLVNSISQSGRDQVVVLNIGNNSGIQPGDVLAVETHGGEIIDRRGKGGYERVAMPNTRTGVVMVFKTFDKVSYALVMESTLPVRVNDVVSGI